MRNSTLLKLSAFFLLVAALCSCSRSGANKGVRPENIKLFPPQDVCNYPANVTAKVFHGLGGGTWSPRSPNDPQAGYACSGELSLIQISAPTESPITVEYLAAGNIRGSNMITLEYAASGPGPIANESTYRTVYLNFANDVIKQALKEPMTDLMRKKIANLGSYFKGGRAEEEFFPLGDGFVILIRENNEAASSIKITTRIYPDIALKLDTGRP